MGGVNGRAQLLGQQTEVQITEMSIAPALFFQMVDQFAGIRFAGKVLRIVDPAAGRAIFSPITPQAARTIAGVLLQYADDQSSGEASHGGATVHE